MSRKPPFSSPAGKMPALLERDNLTIHNILDKVERTFLPVGAQIGKYRIIEEVDRGGMAVVYKATQLDLNRTVALKVLPANVTINRRFVERFLSEAHAVAKLNHPNIVSIHEVSMENNVYFLAMDYVPGTNLFYFMNEKKPKLVDVLEIFIQLADALSYSHEQRIVHRDLKLNNVIMRDNRLPVLIDFGLAKAIEDEEEGLTRTGEIMGSPAYMAPERILGSGADSRSDICSLGIMLYELLSLKNPYLDPRSIHQTTLNVIEADPVAPRKLVPWLPAEVEAITLKAMQREPAARYQTMKEFRDDLLRYQRGEQVLANPPSLLSKLKHRARKNWPVLSIGATVLVFAAVLALVLHFQSRKEQWHWRLIVQEQFNEPLSVVSWHVYDGDSAAAKARWAVKDGVLQVKGSGFSFLRYERLFTRDLRFEFDIHSRSRTLHDVGFFICGNDPFSGYTLHIHRGPEARNGVTFPNSSLLFAEYNRLAFPSKTSYHVVVEKLGSTITFAIDNVTIARIHDHFLPLGKKHHKVGFIKNGSEYTVDNLRIYRLAMPELARPTIIADRFREHGEFRAALDEYNELLLDVSREDIVHTVRMRMADCLLRLGDFERAEAALSEGVVEAGKTDARVAHMLYLQGVLAERRGQPERAARSYRELARRFPANTRNSSVCAATLIRTAEWLDRDSVGIVEKQIAGLLERYPRHAKMCGEVHLKILRRYASQSDVNRAEAAWRKIQAGYERYPDVLGRARVILAGMYLGRRRKQKAVDMLNQAVAAHEQSEASWEAWMMLGDMYAHEHNYGDALTTYRKVYEECPNSVPARWEARIKTGEIARAASYSEAPRALFMEVVRGKHPFALPRLIGQYYTDKVSEELFVDAWHRQTGTPSGHLYYTARKRMIAGKHAEALEHLEQYLSLLAPESWEYVKAYALTQYCQTK